MGGVLERRSHVGRVLAMRLGNLRQRLAWQLSAELLGCDADRGGRGVQLEAEAARSAAAAAATREALTAGRQAGVRARLRDGGFQSLGGDVEALGQSVDEALIARLLARRCGRRLRLGRGDADGGAAQDEHRRARQGKAADRM